MYDIINWDTNELITSSEKLATAKRLCRAQGHTGDGNGGYYAPVAFVQESGFCVYNPKFRVGKHDHLKAENFVVALDNGAGWELVDTRGSLPAANILARNTSALMVAVFTKAQWADGNLDRPRYLHDNRDKSNLPVKGLEGLVNSVPAGYF